jgi:hypothetical protein
MNYEEIKNKFYKAVDNPAGWQHVSHFFKKLKAEKPNVVLDVLLSVFIEKSEKNSLYAVQELAGGCLWKLRPKYKRNPGEDIRNILQNWDVSVEELPWYFVDAIGNEALIAHVESILKEKIPDAQKKKAKTILYWVAGRDDKSFKDDLNRKWKKIKG